MIEDQLKNNKYKLMPLIIKPKKSLNNICLFRIVRTILKLD